MKDIQEKLSKVRQWNNLNLHFDEESHTYYVKGNIKPSVSGMLNYFKTEEEIEKFNSPEFQEFLRPYAKFGTYIHKQTELIDRGYIPDVMEYEEKEWIALERYQILTDKLKDEGYEVVAIELPLYSTKFDTCGTIDRLFINKQTGKVLLVDIKTGSTRDTHWYQQLTYKSILAEWGINIDDISLISLKLKSKIPTFSKLKEEKRIELEMNWLNMENEVINEK